jgi:hypothetical protein
MAFMLHSKTINDIHALPDTELDLINVKLNTFVLEDSGNTHNSVKLKGGYVLDTGVGPSAIHEQSAVLTAHLLLTTISLGLTSQSPNTWSPSTPQRLSCMAGEGHIPSSDSCDIYLIGIIGQGLHKDVLAHPP